MPVTEFGWPLPQRQNFFHDLANDGAAARYQAEIDFMDKRTVLPVWCVPIGLPRYRLFNGRTSSLQQEWLAKNPRLPKDFFAGDPERDEVQKVQHELLRQLINEKDLLPFFTKPENRQTGYLILDSLGFVINGNRRLCAWRELLAKDGQKYAHLKHIDIVVLPKADDQAIDKLEAQLQLEPDILAEYRWHAFANMLLDRMRLHGMDAKTLARMYDKRESQIEELIDMRAYAADYLKVRGKEGRWSEVGDEYAFRAMVAKRKLISGTGEKKLFEAGAYVLLDDPGGGRLYDYIPDLHKYRVQVREKLLAEFPVDPDVDAGNDPLGVDTEEVINQRLAQVVDEPANRARAAEIIKDVIDTHELLEKEKDSARYVLRQLQKANAAIQSALTTIHRPDTVRDGVSQTIDSIDAGLLVLRKWLKGNA